MEETQMEDRGVKTTQTTFEIIEALQKYEGRRIAELSKEFDIAESTVHRHLTTLLSNNYVVKEGNTYQLSLKFLDIGDFTRNRKSSYQMARGKVEEIAEITEERAQFIVEENGFAVYVHRERGKNAVKTDPGLGKRVPIHMLSAGKAILAHLPEKKVENIISERGLERRTHQTITSTDELLSELGEIRERGYSFNNQENIDGLKAVGVPVLRTSDQVIGALSVSGPSHRMKGEWFQNDLPDLLLGAANELELNISASN